MGWLTRHSIEAAHGGLLSELDASVALSEDASRCGCRAASVSGWSVQQHLEHLLLSDRSVLGWVNAVRGGTAKSDGPGGPTLPGRLVLALHMIPRGKGRAPDLTLPASMDLASIREGLGSVRETLERLGGALPALAAYRCTRRHHVLGYFTPAQWLRFLHIHHVHHRRIIRDILSVAASA